MNMPITIMVVYDGIKNSVFQSQVIEVLKKNPGPVHLILFEKEEISSADCQALIPETFSYTIFKKYPFLGIWSLQSALWDLQDYIKKLKEPYRLIARGPHAGYIALKSLNKQCLHLTIQARGLVAEEYYYHTTKQWSFLGKLIASLRYILFARLEYFTFKKQPLSCPYTIEAVSNALKSYIIQRFDADPQKVSLAANDTMPIIPIEKKLQYRTAIRTQLALAHNAPLYCYNGSAKAWQCPEETIAFFKQERAQSPHAHLLILSQDIKQFHKFAEMSNLDTNSYTILSLPHEEVFPYLCAADYGILFREKHIINWVSRPTKALEYKSAGLTIIHNHTVGCIDLYQ